MSNRYWIAAALSCSAIAITACAPSADSGDDPPAEATEVSAIGAIGTVGSPTLTVTGGLAYSCAAGSSGIRCWGSDTNGQLGDNATGQRIQPVPVTGIVFGTAMLSAGGLHTCAVVNAGAKCWGANNAGQLGNGPAGNDMTPVFDSHVPVDVTNLTSGVQAIAGGDSHTCAVVNGAAKCWGLNNFGQVGDNTTTPRHSPAAVSSISGVQAIAAGGAHSCAIVNGAAMCWGLNSSGQLGNATPGDPPPGDSHVPVPVTGLGSGVIAIAAGENHTCAIVTGGAVKCWGNNASGQLGNSATGGIAATPVPVTGLGSGAIAIAAGHNHTCAVAAGGAAKCWGSNDSGQLGDGSPDPNLPLPPDSNAPVQVTGLTSGVQSIATGSQHSCATTTAGGVFCWGLNSSAQIAADPNDPTLGSLFAAPRQIGGLVLGGCADGTDEQVFNNGMVGCAGKVTFATRGTLCAAGYQPATSLQWSTNRGAGIPIHHYWTNDPLMYSGSGSSACFVSMSVGTDCGADTPMRVCAVNLDDPESNHCNWTQCGLYTNANQYFGGCSGNTTAGTLCIPNIDPPSACSQYNSCPKWENGYATSTSTENTGIAGNTVSCTQFCADAGVCNPASCGQMSAPTAACNNQATTRLNQVRASIATSVGGEANFDSVAALQARSSAAQSTVSVTTSYHVADWGFSQNCGFAGGGTDPGFVVGGGGGGGGGTGCQLFWSQAVVCDVNITAPSPSSAQNDACGCAH
jgi:alpha-tubulin suppressor-like RCC1 family protein